MVASTAVVLLFLPIKSEKVNIIKILLEAKYALLYIAFTAFLQTALACESVASLALLPDEYFNNVVWHFAYLMLILEDLSLFFLTHLRVLIVLTVNHGNWFLTSETEQNTFTILELI
jgi:hypothetical protein